MNKIRGSKIFKNTWYCGEYTIQEIGNRYYLTKDAHSGSVGLDYWWQVIDYLGEVRA